LDLEVEEQGMPGILNLTYPPPEVPMSHPHSQETTHNLSQSNGTRYDPQILNSFNNFIT